MHLAENREHVTTPLNKAALCLSATKTKEEQPQFLLTFND